MADPLALPTSTDIRHPAHCIDAIRQVLMCNVDTRLMGQVWYDKEHPRAFPDFNTKHTCKNYDVVRAWAKEREVCATQVSLGRTYPDIHHSCRPPTSSPKITRGGQITWMMFSRTRHDRRWRGAYTYGDLMKALLCFQGLSWAIVLGERYHVYTTAKQNRKNVSGVWRTGRKVRIFLGDGGIGSGARYGSAELNTKAPLKEQKYIDLVIHSLRCPELSVMTLPFVRSRPRMYPKRKRKVPKSVFEPGNKRRHSEAAKRTSRFPRKQTGCQSLSWVSCHQRLFMSPRRSWRFLLRLPRSPDHGFEGRGLLQSG